MKTTLPATLTPALAPPAKQAFNPVLPKIHNKSEQFCCTIFLGHYHSAEELAKVGFYKRGKFNWFSGVSGSYEVTPLPLLLILLQLYD